MAQLAVKTKWREGHSTDTVIFGTTRNEVVTKLKALFKQVCLFFFILFLHFSNKQ